MSLVMAYPKALYVCISDFMGPKWDEYIVEIFRDKVVGCGNSLFTSTFPPYVAPTLIKNEANFLMPESSIILRGRQFLTTHSVTTDMPSSFVS